MNERAASLPQLARRVWELLDGRQRRDCLWSLVVSGAAGCVTVAGVAGIAPFLATLADPSVVERNGLLAWLRGALGNPPIDDFLVWLGVGFVATLVAANAVNLLAMILIGRFSHRVGTAFHALLFDEYLRRGVAFHRRSNGDVLATQVVQDVTRTIGGVIQSGLLLATSALSVCLIAAAVIAIDPTVALGAALVLGSSYAIIYSVVRRRLLRDGSLTQGLWAERARLIAESFDSVKDVVIFRAREDLVAQVAAQSAAIASAHSRLAAIASTPRYVLECVTAAGLVAAALWTYRTTGPGQWVTQFAVLGLAAYRLLPPLQQAFAAVARIRSDAPAFERIADDLLRARRRPMPVPRDAAAGDWASRPRREIRLARVSYRHAPEREGGVSDVSLRIEAGTLVGLVGPNGSGKTTLADLLLGVLVPQAGRIEVDGVPLDERNADQWLSAVAHVPQNIVLLDATVAQNVAFGVAPADIDAQRVREALRAVQLETAIDALPQGVATPIGQNGVQLSGGQRQRLGIARALYRRASLLVLDEATSALDTSTETEVVSLLRALRDRCTIVLIAHRPSSLRGCDEIFELLGGRLVDRGGAGWDLATRSASP
jgi:ATP-binding cassette, subfamily B, bacterial PglK